MAGPPGGIETAIAERRQARDRDRRRARQRRVLLWAGRLLALALVFLAGYVIGRAVEQAPLPGGTQTRVQTLRPGTLPPVTRTVTVTSESS
jgi:hypothetical protein